MPTTIIQDPRVTATVKTNPTNKVTAYTRSNLGVGAVSGADNVGARTIGIKGDTGDDGSDGLDGTGIPQFQVLVPPNILTNLDQFPITLFKTVKYLFSITDVVTNEVFYTEVFIVNTETTVTGYGGMSSRRIFTLDINAIIDLTNVTLSVTSTSSPNDLNFIITRIASPGL